MSWTCPLTPIENSLRTRASQLGYPGGFVQHYIGPVVYPRGVPRQLELVAGNALVYTFILACDGRCPAVYAKNTVRQEGFAMRGRA